VEYEALRDPYSMHLRELIQALALDRAYHRPIRDISEVDLQGWNSRNPMLAEVIRERRPAQIVEVGSWKGASAIYIAECAREYDNDITILCVDTFTGSNAALWRQEDIARVRDEYGFPTTYRQFIFNVTAFGLSHNIFPLPTTSACGAELLAHFEVCADLIYIDGGHREEEVALDLQDYWRVLKPGGVLVGDDYSQGWPGVIAAVDKFAALHGVPLRAEDRKWRIDKPSQVRVDRRGESS
jgi:predicted O-methyltransferase YrrM